MVLLSSDEWEEICIVPVDEEVAMAIECADYQSLLISIGMQPPSDMVRICIGLKTQGSAEFITRRPWAVMPKQNDGTTKGPRVINSMFPCVLKS